VEQLLNVLVIELGEVKTVKKSLHSFKRGNAGRLFIKIEKVSDVL